MLNTLEMERYIQATARRGDLRVVWKEGLNAPSTNGETINLPAMADDITASQYKRLLAYVVHEVDHVRRTDHKMWASTGLSAETSLLGAVWNFIEDHRMRYQSSKEYEGDRLVQNDVYTETLESIVKNAARIKTSPAAENLLPLVAADNAALADFLPSVHRMVAPFEGILTDKGKELRAKLDAMGFLDKVREVRELEDVKKGTQATLNLAKQVYEKVYEQDAEKEMQRAQKAAKKAAKGQGEGEEQQEGQAPGNGEGEGEQESDKEGGGKAKKAKAGKEGETQDADEFIHADYTDLTPDAHTEKRVRSAGGHLDYSKFKAYSNNYLPAKDGDYQTFNYTDGSRATSALSAYGAQIKTALDHTSAAFAHKVRTILQIRARDRYQYGLKRGQLNSSSLYRVTLKDAPGFNERVFKKKQVNNVLDAAVTLVVDQSGSMGGSKFTHAAAAAAMMNDVIGNQLHIPVEIVSFTSGSGYSGGEKVAMLLHRQHKDRLVSTDTVVARLATGVEQGGMGGNADGDAIMWAFDRLVKRPEQRKLLIVFSDGSPAAHTGRGEIDGYTQRVIKRIEKESPVDIVGIGIQDDNVTRLYEHNQTINNPNQLEGALLATIEDKLK